MSRRIEIELTSDRGDGTWTWRAAGARQPRGVLEASLLPAGAKAGDVLRAEVEVDIDGTTVTSVAAGPERERREPERIEIVGSGGRDDELVTTRLVGRGDRGDRGDRRDRRDRPPRRDGEGRDRRDGREGREGREGGRDRPPRREGEGAGRRPGGDGREGREGRGGRDAGRERRERRPAPPPLPERPKPKRLRPGRAHRKAVLAELPPEQQPIAEEVLKGGIPAVRAAIDAENDKRTAAGEPAIDPTELLAIAEQLLPRLRTADWRDRADAALADAGELDLRDLRSVVVAADVAARDDETRAMAADLRTRLDQRVEAEQATWLEDLQLALGAGRVVRALRLSSRPPKAGTILPPDVRSRLAESAGAALASDVGADRWAAVLDAVAYAPVRADVKPASVPEAPADELLAVVKKFASRVPAVARAFGIETPATKRPSGRALRPPKPPKRSGVVPVPKRDVTPGAIGAPIGAQPAPADVEPDDVRAPAEVVADVVAPGAAAAAAPTPEPVQPSVAASPPPVLASNEPGAAAPDSPDVTSTPATTAVDDAGVAEAATPMEEVSAELDEVAEAEERVGPPPVAEAEVTTGAPEAAMPVAPPDAGEPDADPDAVAALEAAPDVDDISDGEPT